MATLTIAAVCAVLVRRRTLTLGVACRLATSDVLSGNVRTEPGNGYPDRFAPEPSEPDAPMEPLEQEPAEPEPSGPDFGVYIGTKQLNFGLEYTKKHSDGGSFLRGIRWC